MAEGYGVDAFGRAGNTRGQPQRDSGSYDRQPYRQDDRGQRGYGSRGGRGGYRDNRDRDRHSRDSRDRGGYNSRGGGDRDRDRDRRGGNSRDGISSRLGSERLGPRPLMSFKGWVQTQNDDMPPDLFKAKYEEYVAIHIIGLSLIYLDSDSLIY